MPSGFETRMQRPVKTTPRARATPNTEIAGPRLSSTGCMPGSTPWKKLEIAGAITCMCITEAATSRSTKFGDCAARTCGRSGDRYDRLYLLYVHGANGKDRRFNPELPF